MPARIDTKKDVICNHDDLLTWMESPICISDPDQFSEFLELFTIEETQTLIKPEANPLEAHVIEWINENVSEGTYDNPKDTVSALMNHGCKSGFVTHLINTSDQRQFCDDYQEHIEVIIEDLIDNVGEAEHIIRGGEWNHQTQKFSHDDFSFDNMRERFAFIGFEETARNLIIECGYEDEF